MEICFVEFSFLQMMKGMFASNLKTKIPQSHHALTQVTFGRVMEFATTLKLPSKYTGYCFILDKSNRIRWRACGLAEDKTTFMFSAADALLKEST